MLARHEDVLLTEHVLLLLRLDYVLQREFNIMMMMMIMMTMQMMMMMMMMMFTCFFRHLRAKAVLGLFRHCNHIY